MSIIDDVLAKDPETRTIEFCLDHELRLGLAEAQFELEKAMLRLKRRPTRPGEQDDDQGSELEEIEERIADLAEQARGRMVRFTFVALNPEEFDKLVSSHRPTPKQKDDARKADKDLPAEQRQGPMQWNVDTFPPALLSAACIKVEAPTGEQEGLALEDAARLWSSPAYNESERAEIFATALSASKSRMRFDLPKAG